MPAIRTYDANGNLTHDGRQDLDIRWNIFNLASGAETHDGGSLTLARLSDGTLFASKKVSGSNTTGKRYCGSFVFTTGTGNTTPQVESVAWDEGRIFADAAGNYHDCWFAGDHLGNIRSVLDITPDVTVPIPLEQNDYLPFGTKISNPLHVQMNTNRWRYAGKEEFPDLNQLDFGARMYDPFTARWTAVDPMAGRYYRIGPYAYCANNPVNVVDPEGTDWYINNSNGYYTWFDGNSDVDGYTYFGPQGSLFGEGENLINDFLQNRFNIEGMFTNGFTFEIASPDKSVSTIDFQSYETGFLWDFAFNIGPEFSVMLINHPFTQELASSPISENLLEKMREGVGTIQLSRVWRPKDVFLTSSLALQFIGSYTVLSKESAGRNYVYNLVGDSKSRTSLFLHLPFKKT